MYRQAVAEERTALRNLARRAGDLAERGDQATLRTLADEIRHRIAAGNEVYRTGGHLRGNLHDIVAVLDAAYDRAFPVADPADVAGLLDVPWPTKSRAALLAAATGDRWFRPGPLAECALRDGDVRMLRLLLANHFHPLSRAHVASALDALQSAGDLDAATVEQQFAADPYLWHGIAGTDPISPQQAGTPAACLPFVRDVVDEMFWDGTTSDTAAAVFPKIVRPRGLRFVQRAIERPKTADVLGAADLTGAERAEFVRWLGDRPAADHLRAFTMRLPAGDAESVLPLLGLAAAAPLFRLACASATDGAQRHDLATIRDAAAAAGEEATRSVLKLRPSEAISAALGHNRAAVEKRVRHNALAGIAAYGLLPLTDGETVLDRYTFLREVAKRGAKLGPNRRHSHAAAIEVAIDHLAQVAGFEDANRLEWHCEAEIAEAPAERQLGAYTVAVRVDGADAMIEVAKAGKVLRTVPQEVRRHPEYPQLREHQERLRDQARRMRTGLVERLVAGGGTLTPGELGRLLRLPSGAAMLPDLVWRDRTGAFGLLADVDADGPVTAAHPYDLYQDGVLGHWQAEIVRRRIRQPVKQVFRELYVLTPAERDAGTRSARFAGHRVDGKVAARLLSARGWTILSDYDEYQAVRPAGNGVTAGLRCDFHGYFGMGDVLLGEVSLLERGAPVPLTEAHPVAFSEAMRDLDLVVSIAGTDPDGYASPLHAESRAQLLGALIAELGLSRVTVDGTSAVVRGTRATYRVHLNSGSIHVEPGGYLCVVPATFGKTRHGRLFLPFADEDPMTSVVLSKVLLLAEDEKITDRSILDQLARLTA
ncbi:hypothetical protein GCM10010399_61560 [Dactylosporangium fulvum]